ncbi:hypothetical protein VNI00_003164 [Paramarasmius palmivorus]|uniref:F-box domain-containing protein n=1 Tax=Paramarasmius palmivorus TaxID=297713 RepID=A0AAW0DQ70_9AGAR
MIKLTELPFDILFAIISPLSKREMKAARGICKMFNSILEPLVFVRIVFDAANSRRFTSQLRDLAKGWTRAGTYAKILEIRALSAKAPSQAGSDLDTEEDPNELDVAMDFLDIDDQNLTGQLLFDAVRSMIGLTTLEWYMEETDPPWAGGVIMNALSTVDSISSVSLHLPPHAWFGNAVPIAAGRFKGLQCLQVRCIESEVLLYEVIGAIRNSPTLEFLDVGVGFSSKNGKTEEQRFNIDELFDGLSTPLPLTRLALEGWEIKSAGTIGRHLKTLKFLEVEDCAITKAFWDFLRDERISLASIRVNEITGSLLHYLETYSGPERLDLRLRHPHILPPEEVEILAKKFFTEVLPTYSEVLHSLSIIPEIESAWCVDMGNVNSFSSCSKLVALSVIIKDDPADKIVASVLYKL